MSRLLTTFCSLVLDCCGAAHSTFDVDDTCTCACRYPFVKIITPDPVVPLDQNNDDPMLDYGAAVAIKFASSKNAIRGMTPAEYGGFLRNDPDQIILLENASCAPAERAKVGSGPERSSSALRRRWVFFGKGMCVVALLLVWGFFRGKAPTRHTRSS